MASIPSDNVVFTMEMDESLRAALSIPQFRGVGEAKLAKSWESLARHVIGNPSGKACMKRWAQIHTLPGLEYKSLLEVPSSGPGLFVSGSCAEIRSRSSSDASRQIVETLSRPSATTPTPAEIPVATVEPLPPADIVPLLPVLPSPPKLVIHVCDDHRGVTKDFICDKTILLSGMKYFQDYINDATPTHDIDISVHCDVTVFEWLVKYLEAPLDARPTLEVNMVVSVLISAEFLRMAELVKDCTRFIRYHLSEVIKLPIDLRCLNEPVVNHLAEMLEAPEIERVKDPKDKLISRLYQKKTEELLAHEGRSLNRCAFCSKVYCPAHRVWMICPKAKIFIDFHGNVLREHVAERSFDADQYVISLKRKKLPWREIYWKIWGILTVMNCSVCQSPFIASEYAHCAYHPSDPVFHDGGNSGVYPCCGAPTVRFSAGGSERAGGCKANNHVVVGSSEAALLSLAVQFGSLVRTPFVPTQLPASSTTPSRTLELSDTDDPRGVSRDLSDMDEDAADDRSFDNNDDDDSDSDDDPSSTDSDAPETHIKPTRILGAKLPKSPSSLQPPSAPKTPLKKGEKISGPKLSPRRQRIHMMDRQRDEDIARMAQLTGHLDLLRKDEKKMEEKPYPGGSYAKIEQRYRSEMVTSKSIKHLHLNKFMKI